MSLRIVRSVVAGSAFLLTVCSISTAAPFGPGNLVALRAGNGGPIAAGPADVQLEEYRYDGTVPVFEQQIVIPSGEFAVDLGSTSSGFLQRSVDGYSLEAAGYRAPTGGFTGTGPMGGRTAAEAPRALLSVASDATYTPLVLTGLTNEVIQSAFKSANARTYFTTNFGIYLSNGDGSLTYINYQTPGPRGGLAVLGGDLVYTNSNLNPTIVGAVQQFVGEPLVSSADTTAFNSSSATVGFTALTFNPAGTVCYIGTTTGKVRKYVRAGLSWNFSFEYSVNGGVQPIYGVIVDFNVTPPQIICSSASDLSIGPDDGVTPGLGSFATPGTNFQWRGVAFAPNRIPANNRPTVSITQPTRSRATRNRITLAGVAADVGGSISRVTYSVTGRGTRSGTALGTSSWFTRIRLRARVNRVRVTAYDNLGTPSLTATRRIVYRP